MKLEHMSEKHGIGGGKCAEFPECGSLLCSKEALEQHILKNNRVCKICKQEFDSEVEKNEHQLSHTTCTICGGTFPSVSKLDRHTTVRMSANVPK